MQLPKLDRIVDTFIKIENPTLDKYIAQLRSDLIPEIRKLESEGSIVWYAFLVHGQKHLGDRVHSADKNSYIHIRLCPSEGTDIEDFIESLPNHFEQPEKVSLSSIAGVDRSILKEQDWAYGWKLHGETSEWVLKMIETHDQNASIHIQQIIQFLHFITNPLLIGNLSFFSSSKGSWRF